MDHKRILIVSEAGDLHSDAVAWALRKKGQDCQILRTPDFPTLLSVSMHLAPDDRTGRFLMRGPDVMEVDLGEPFDAVWMRRPGEAVLPDDMHPGDKEIAARQCALFLAGIAPFLDRGGRTFWVNPPASDLRAQQKACQLRSAVRVGLAIPETPTRIGAGRLEKGHAPERVIAPLGNSARGSRAPILPREIGAGWVPGGCRVGAGCRDRCQALRKRACSREADPRLRKALGPRFWAPMGLSILGGRVLSPMRLLN